MKSCSLFLVLALGSLALAQETDEAMVRMERLLSVTTIKVDALPKDLRVAELLAAIEKQIGKDKKIAVRLDEKTLGPDAAKIAERRVRLPPFVPTMHIMTLFAYAIQQLNADLEIGLRTEALVLTRPLAAAYTRTYDVRDLVETEPETTPDKGEAMSTTAMLRTMVELKAGESMHVVNGSRVILRASVARQVILQDTINALRRLNEVQVYMNGRIYEVPAAFYAEHISSLFKRPKDQDPPAVVAAPTSLVKRITAHKLILESDDVSLRPGQRKTFLAWQEPRAFSASPMIGTLTDRAVLSGVELKARPQVSPDRRFLKLEIEQRVEEVLGIDKVKQLERESGKEVVVESPRVRRSSSSGVVKIPDAGAVLAPLDFHPRSKESEGKVWVMVARPVIWIPEEIELLRKQGTVVTPKSAWQMEPEAPNPAPPAPPLTLKAKELLQAALTDVLTNSNLKETRNSYGGENGKHLVLENGGKASWPADFSPATHGYRLATLDPFDAPPQVLVVRLDAFTENPDAKATELPIQLSISGGGLRLLTIGSCHVSYSIKQKDGRWTVQLESAFDP